MNRRVLAAMNLNLNFTEIEGIFQHEKYFELIFLFDDYLLQCPAISQAFLTYKRHRRFLIKFKQRKFTISIAFSHRFMSTVTENRDKPEKKEIYVLYLFFLKPASLDLNTYYG